MLQSTEQNHRPSASIAQGGCLRDLPVLYNFISLLWTDIAGQVALYDRWTIHKLSVWCEAHVPNHSNIMATTGRDGVFHSGPAIPTPTVCDSVSWVVEVRICYQSVHMYVCTNERLLYSVMICSICKIHRSRKQLPCAIHGFLREVWIHRLRSEIHGSCRSTDCAQHTHTQSHIHMHTHTFANWTERPEWRHAPLFHPVILTPILPLTPVPNWGTVNPWRSLQFPHILLELYNIYLLVPSKQPILA